MHQKLASKVDSRKLAPIYDSSVLLICYWSRLVPDSAVN